MNNYLLDSFLGHPSPSRVSFTQWRWLRQAAGGRKGSSAVAFGVKAEISWQLPDVPQVFGRFLLAFFLKPSKSI